VSKPTPPLPPTLHAQYDPIRLLGAGGMGTVWLVRDRILDRLVALKVLRDDLTAESDRERFLREARTAARLVHPHIVPIFRAGEADGATWFTMAFVDGESLGDRLRDRGPLPAIDVARSLREAASALAYAHARGVVHRDVKPDNLLLDRESGRTLVTDFGIARDVTTAASALTTGGNVLGTVAFMSPEQAAGDPLDGRSDVYALGVVGFLVLSGTLPFDGTPQAILVAHVTKPAPSLASVLPTVHPLLTRVIDRCLLKAPADRYESAEALAAAIDDAIDAMRETPSPRVAVGGSSALSEADAMIVWQRAAQLQAEAAHRMERTMSIRRTGSLNGAEEAGAGTFAASDVEAAAIEAGISRQYVALAIAERASENAPAPLVVGDSEDRRVTALLGVAVRGISVARIIPAAKREVLSALRRIATAQPYWLELDEIVGGHPLDGGILRFSVPTYTKLVSRLNGSGVIPPLGHRCNEIDLRLLNISLASRGTVEAPATELVISGDLRDGLRKNVTVSQLVQAGSGVAFTAAGTGLGVMAGMSILAALPGVAAAGAGVVLARWGYRASYRHGVRKAQEELDGLLRAVQRAVTEDAIFGGPPTASPTSGTTRGSDDQGLSILLMQ
jgi:eukaryotic-like serine/threonine-protein kinase